jgi:F0F1-type ATP synthase membrane subunit a
LSRSVMQLSYVKVTLAPGTLFMCAWEYCHNDFTNAKIIYTVIWGLMFLFCTHAYRMTLLQCSQKSKHIHYPQSYRTPMAMMLQHVSRTKVVSDSRVFSNVWGGNFILLIGSYNMQPALKWERYGLANPIFVITY